MTQAYDAIIVGLGGMGAAALLALARCGRRVLGIDQFDVPSDLNASGGHHTRIFRFSYFEDPRYVPLMERAYEMWRELEQHRQDRIVHSVGCLEIGPLDGRLVGGALTAARLHGLPHELLTSSQIARRFPAWSSLPRSMVALFESRAGFLRADRGLAAMLDAAMAAGAEVLPRTAVTAWRAGADRVVVEAAGRRHEAGHLVVAAGGWSARLLPEIAPLAQPERQVVVWFAPRRRELFEDSAFPAFGLETDTGLYYGFPRHEVPGFKFARYNHRGESGDAAFRRDIEEADIALLADAVSRYLPEGAGPALAARPCLFTNTPDGHFILDRHPGHANVLVAGGCSGHAYKFLPAIGEALADLVTDGRSRHDIGLFSLSRFEAAPLATLPPIERSK